MLNTLHTALLHISQHLFILCRNGGDCTKSQACMLLQRTVNKVTADCNKCVFFPPVSEFHVSTQDL
jgi:hypothetical protein